MITIEDVGKLEIKIGRVLSAEKVENADKLLKLEVNFGPSASSGQVPAKQNSEQNSLEGNSEQVQVNEEQVQQEERMIRQILSGIAEFYKPEDLIGKEFPFIVNLEPRMIRGLESQGMILTVCSDETIALLSPDKEVKEGSVVR
ncbi:MAG: hypothetical protein Q8P10_00095 [bacterium]|nr:hypothetical protein [bacterium]